MRYYLDTNIQPGHPLRFFYALADREGRHPVPEAGIGEPAGGRKAALSPVLMSKVSENSVTVLQIINLLIISRTVSAQIAIQI